MVKDCEIDVQWALVHQSWMPADEDIIKWITTSLESVQQSTASSSDCGVSVSLKIITASEMKELNNQYRRQETATNVLSFPLHGTLENGAILLGDIAVCADVVRSEAEAQGKNCEAHFAHIIVHGTLHLSGYDHITDRDAEMMERKEIEILSKMGFSNPYGEPQLNKGLSKGLNKVLKQQGSEASK